MISIANIADDMKDGTKQKLIEEEKFINEELPKILDNNPDQFRYTMFERSRDLCGCYGTERVKVLRHAFRTIIQNILPLQFKVYLAMFTQSTIPKLIKLGRDKNKYNRRHYKFRRVSTMENDTNTDINKPQLSEKSAGLEESIEEILDEFSFTDNILDHWERTAGQFHTNLKTLRGYVQKLVKTRNKILTLLKTMHEYFYDSDMYKGYSKKDISELGKLCQRMKGSSYVSPHNLWMVSKKTTAEDEYEDDQLSWAE